MPTTAAPATVADLLAAVLAYRPTVEDGALAFAVELPTELGRRLWVLHTGVRAALAGRPWYGCGSERKAAAPRPLDPAAPIPPGVTLLCVEGDRRWDRIDPDARLDLPDLFVP
ncbi:hypothetical protein [Urbifossiella limnaea]|uniref:Uncharacterized protein n=1 Tax=Urbifossiella limnaea TaxID=2528023 RepID=A0A517Y1D4_9BACT|nr:hypothetical protein [Urbifossiella limnaea]QDU23586.1 hypothetical protein ETAA1_55880 [Urbifossiella limnaea]